MENYSYHFKNDILPKIILPAVKNAYEAVDEEFREDVDFKNIVDSEYEAYLSNFYERKRDWLKNTYFDSLKSEEEKCLDMHKIAAVICRSIIGCKPFSFDVKKANEYKKDRDKNEDISWIIDNYFVNYKVAVNCAFGITLYDLLDKLGEEKKVNNSNLDTLEIAKKVLEHGFNLYKNPLFVTPKHETFYISTILNVAINDANKRDFDYLGFATICFQLQQYETLKWKYELNK